MIVGTSSATGMYLNLTWAILVHLSVYSVRQYVGIVSLAGVALIVLLRGPMITYEAA